jgi:hypothetical protein
VAAGCELHIPRMTSPCRLIASLLMLAVPAFAQDAAQESSIAIPLTSDQWSFQYLYQRSRRPGQDTVPRFETHLGAQSLFVPSGFAWARGVALRSGTLDADVAADSGGAFFGIAFHVATPPDQYEVIFFRPHSAEHTVQYSPSFFHMNAWQFFPDPDYGASPAFPQDRWVHVRVVIHGPAASVYFDTATTPTIEIHDLTLGDTTGTIGFWARGGGGYVSNIRYRPDPTTYPTTRGRTFLPGTITDGWLLSPAFQVSERSPEMYPHSSDISWQPVHAEREGIVLIGRYRPDPNVEGPRPDRDEPAKDTPGSEVVFARTAIASDRDTVRKMWIGYSDNVVVYLNGRAMFAGRNSMAFRDPDDLGYVYPYAEAVFLPLKKGRNELMLAVTETTAGWGFICRFDSP